MSIFNDEENQLILAARILMADGLARLKKREACFPCKAGRAEREACRGARDLLANSLVAEYGALRHEMAIMSMFDAQGRLIETVELARGGATHCQMRPRLIAEHVLRTGASGILLAHNHPSGECSPSKADVDLTQAFVQWCGLMEVELIDHLVLTVNDWSSILGNWN
jgi:DNA repair protein RadC